MVAQELLFSALLSPNKSFDVDSICDVFVRLLGFLIGPWRIMSGVQHDGSIAEFQQNFPLTFFFLTL